MTFVKHPLIKPDTIEMRTYQEAILGTASQKNTLCVIPTGMGKTTIAVLLAALRLDKNPDSKILIMAPTRPLCEQHLRSFQKFMEVPEEEIVLITGKISPRDREDMYDGSKIISATPQTIQNDIKSGLLNFSKFSLLVVDECHRSVKKYAYPFVARAYMEKSKYPRILALTASPGSNEIKINIIRKNLSIDAVEIRTESDPDVSPYVKEIETEIVKVSLSDDLKTAQENLKKALNRRLGKLKRYNLNIKTKGELLDAQRRVSKEISTNRKPVHFHMISLIVESIKIWHALQLLETQSISAVSIYIEKVRQKKTKSDAGILNDVEFMKAVKIIEESGEHPKIKKLKEVVKREFDNNKDTRIIIFSHFRDNIYKIEDMLKEVCNPAILIGQSGERGLSQKQQIEVIREFNDGYYNCLIGSPVAEEGLHIPTADIAIFYDTVPSEIRTIQRRGRVGRTKVGKIIFLMTRDTRDEAYYWTAKRRESNMKETLKNMRSTNKTRTITDFL
ncbi:MAG: DEAD/DEAH box helicase [Candidatus Aenigmarchaeota archaeon]|nr:DEAD/DEAH box helicase [Candidatus Aenigmarchaeota archaeon]